MILRFILGDQLSLDISSLKDIDKENDIIFMCEVWDETQYVKHHKKKIAFIFSAMRHFAEILKKDGYRVYYKKLDDEDSSPCFITALKKVTNNHKFSKVIVTEPSEYRVLRIFEAAEKDIGIPIEIREDNRFLCSHKEFELWAKNKKELRMEFFYREMRKKFSILMDGENPIGGAWNFDKENQKTPPKDLKIPDSFLSEPDMLSQEVIKLVDVRFGDHFGDTLPFYFAVTREQALEALNLFIATRLASFGDYQDAMIQGEPWMFHSHLSFYMNIGLLQPLECVRAAEEFYHQGKAPLNAVEGFIRQIIGWREYVRGVYWLKMPSYEKENFLDAQRPLPSLYWGAPTRMNCLNQCVAETKKNAYAHHIQRLMVLGNFALIAGLSPHEVNEWYMIVYADAYQWVELPNVTGMILFADGGFLASKPYAASGAYINKMSNYCKKCFYSPLKKNGAQACPFNYLYWDFLLRNKGKLEQNHRLRMPYNTLSKMTEEKIESIQEDSKRFFRALEKGESI